jgi:hypothetical protein
VAAIRNRKLPIPENAEELLEVHGKGTSIHNEILQRTEQFRYVIKFSDQNFFKTHLAAEASKPRRPFL